MRVVFNQLLAIRQKTGIGHYARQLLRHLRAQGGSDSIEGFPRGWVRRAYQAGTQARPYLDRETSNPGEENVTQPGVRPGWRRGLLKHLRHFGQGVLASHFRQVCKRREYDLYHEPNFIPFPGECPTVATLHDLSVLLHPEWHPRDRVTHFEYHFPRVLAQCRHFLTVSEFTRNEVIHRLGLSPARVSCVYQGIRPCFQPISREKVVSTLQRLNLPPQFLVHVGTIEPRKNVLFLLRAYCSLPETIRSRWPLLLVGKWGWNHKAVTDYLMEFGRSRGVLHLGYTSDEELAAIYNGARALACPSFYEGFGLPPLEMMACGGAVLASTAGALVETVKGQANLLNPEDLDGWRESLIRVVTDDDWWQALRQGAQTKAARYTWDKCAAETLHIYRSLCGARNLTLLQEPPPQRRVAG